MRLVIPVSNVLRDLHGDALIAVALARMGITTYLVPTRRLREIFAIAPDMILLHQLRVNQEDFARTLIACGIPIAVLDVEGMEQIDKYAQMSARDPVVRGAVRRFMTWGSRVADSLIADGYAPEQVMITGSPRHDFYTAPLRQASLRVNAEAAAVPPPLILINANFPYANHPSARHGGDAASKEGDALGITDRLLQEKAQQQIAMTHVVEIANTLAARFPAATVVYRPHPFEDMETYKTLLDPIPNLRLIREGSVDGWILRSKVVIQRACTTAVESALSDVPTLSPRWFPARDYPVPESVSVPVQSMDALIAHVADALDNRMITPPEVQTQVETAIREWFFCMDGDAHGRVASVIRDLAADAHTTDKRACLGELYRMDREVRGARKQIERAIRYCLRLSAETEAQFEKRDANATAATRRFTPDEVQRWIDAIQTAQGTDSPIHARAMTRRDVIAPMQAYYTVIVEGQ